MKKHVRKFYNEMIVFVLLYILALAAYSMPVSAAIMVPVISKPSKTMVEGEIWYVGGGYSMHLSSIDAFTSMRQVWFSLKYNDVLIENNVLSVGQTYIYRRTGDNADVFSTKLDSVLYGGSANMASFKQSMINSSAIGSEKTPEMVSILNSNVLSGAKNISTGESWDLSGGYSLHLNSVDMNSKPSRVSIDLIKNCVKQANSLIPVHNYYSYVEDQTNIFQVYLDSASTDRANFKFPLINELNNSYVPPNDTEKWSCGAWSSCSGSQQTRNCIDLNNCGTTYNKPAISQNCGEIAQEQTTFGISASKSTVSAYPSILVADGVETSTITVIIKDAEGFVLIGKKVSIYSDGGAQDTIIKVNDITNNNGIAVFKIRSQTTGVTNITAKVDGLVLAQSAAISFIAKAKSQVIITLNVNDGDIIQCQACSNPSAIYIVKESEGIKHIRHIASNQIFDYYVHLKWENLKQVASLDAYSLSGWVRVNSGPYGSARPTDRVYEINGDQTRHWINMNAEQFLAHGGSEEAIYNINQKELDLYAVGPDVMLL